MDTEYEDVKTLLRNLGKSKQDLLGFIEWIDGTDSDERMLYDTYITTDEDYRIFMQEFWRGDPDRSLEYILDYIEYKIRAA